MGVPFIGDIIDGVSDLISEAIPDADKKMEIKFKLKELESQAEQRYHDAMIAQIEVNKEEAKHASVFVAGWRPAVGWVGAIGLGYTFVVAPITSWIARVAGYTGEFPALDTQALLYFMGGMLGFGTLRTYEKIKDVARGQIQEDPTPAAKPEQGPVEVEPAPKKKKGGLFRKIGKLV